MSTKYLGFQKSQNVFYKDTGSFATSGFSQVFSHDILDILAILKSNLLQLIIFVLEILNKNGACLTLLHAL